MKNNITYDVPAYKFGIIRVNDSYTRNNIIRWGNDLNKIAEYLRNTPGEWIEIIPFENIDGLLISEVLKTLSIEGPIILCCYAKYEVNHNMNNKYLHMLYNFAIPSSIVNLKANSQIDKVIEEILEKSYKNSSKDTQRVVKCFFERYQDNTHQDTEERIKKLMLNK